MTYQIKGYICQFNKIDQGGDLLLPSILAHDQIIPSKVKMLYQHDITRPLGRWHHIKADGYGVYAEGEILQDFSDGQYASHLIEQHLIDGLSIGYIPLEFYHRPDGVRILQKIELREISIVTFPMQTQARIIPNDVTLDNLIFDDFLT